MHINKNLTVLFPVVSVLPALNLGVLTSARRPDSLSPTSLQLPTSMALTLYVPRSSTALTVYAGSSPLPSHLALAPIPVSRPGTSIVPYIARPSTALTVYAGSTPAAPSSLPLPLPTYPQEILGLFRPIALTTHLGPGTEAVSLHGSHIATVRYEPLPLDVLAWYAEHRLVGLEGAEPATHSAQVAVYDRASGAPAVFVIVTPAYRTEDGDFTRNVTLSKAGGTQDLELQQFYSVPMAPLLLTDTLPKRFGAFDLEVLASSGAKMSPCGTGKETLVLDRVYAYCFTWNGKKYFKDAAHNPKDCLPGVIVKNIVEHIFEELAEAGSQGTTCTMYAHNFARFDSVFLLQGLQLLTASPTSGYEVRRKLWRTEWHGRSRHLLSVDVVYLPTKAARGVRATTITFRDSAELLSGSIAEIGIKWLPDSQLRKGSFPHHFVTLARLGYKGLQPGPEYYPDGGWVQTKGEGDWVLYKEAEAYVETDTRILHLALAGLAKTLYDNFRLDITKSLTLSGAAIRHYRGVHLPHPKSPDQPRWSLPTQVPGLFAILRRDGYVGGMVIMPGQGKLHRKAFAYDMTSMYPSVMATKPIPGDQIYWVSTVNMDDPSVFGWVEALVRAPAGVVPCLLPYGKPFQRRYVGHESLFFGLFFVDELHAAVAIGYQIETYGGYLFNRVEGAFKPFVSDVFALRSKQAAAGDKLGALTTKQILNGLYGRLAIRPIAPRATPAESSQESTTGGTSSKHGVCIPLVATKPELASQPGVSLPISAATTAYARIAISRYMNIPGNALIYSDTDSVVLSRPLDPALVSRGVPQLGVIKSEGLWTDLVISGTKWYTYLDHTGTAVVKAAGVQKGKVTRAMILDAVRHPGTKQTYLSSTWEPNWELGNVSIDTKVHKVTSEPQGPKGKYSNEILHEESFRDLPKQVQAYLGGSIPLPIHLATTV